MNIIVFGSTGKTGIRFVKQALEDGHQVTAFLRTESKLSITHSNLKVVVGSALDKIKVIESIKGHDAVVTCLGSDDGTEKSDLITQMTSNIIKGMKLNGVERIGYVASAGIYKEIPGITGKLVSYLLKYALIDHKNATDLIIDCNLKYTIARPMELTEGPLTKIYRKEVVGIPRNGKRISRADVANFLLQSITKNEYVKETVGLAY